MGGACGKPSVGAAVLPPSNSVGLRTLGYEAEETLGEGAFGDVQRVEHRETNNEYACKKIKEEEHVNAAWLQTEVAILKNCRHPNVVFLREVLTPFDGKQVYLIMELARGGSLLERIEEEKGLPESYAASLTIQLASALDYLHGQAIVHRDMKPENVTLVCPRCSSAVTRRLASS
jgi:serine/threonine protein kinase